MDGQTDFELASHSNRSPRVVGSRVTLPSHRARTGVFHRFGTMTGPRFGPDPRVQPALAPGWSGLAAALEPRQKFRARIGELDH